MEKSTLNLLKQSNKPEKKKKHDRLGTLTLKADMRPLVLWNKTAKFSNTSGSTACTWLRYAEACFTGAPALCRMSESRYRPAIFTAP